jgi:hypothetical protein
MKGRMLLLEGLGEVRLPDLRRARLKNIKKNKHKK